MVARESAGAVYHALSLVEPGGRWSWLQVHAPAAHRGHWWLGLIERAESDAATALTSRPERAAEPVELAVDLIDLAQRDGMPPYYAASRLARLAFAALRSGLAVPDLPARLDPDRLARRILAAIPLGREEALAVAVRVRAEPLDWPGDAQSDALAETNWVVPDLTALEPHLTDGALAAQVRAWTGISGRLASA
jgi:hypothetical protein